MNSDNYYKKRAFKEKLKKNKPIFIGTGSLALIALVVMLVGFIISGWNIVKWWNAGFGPTCIILIVLGAFGAWMFWFVITKAKGHNSDE